MRHQPRNFENVTLVARRREDFRVYLANFRLPLPKRVNSVHNNLFASCQRYRHSVESRALMSPFEQSDLSAWSLLSWHPTHTYVWGRLCCIQVVCSPLSRSRRATQIMSTERFSQTRLLNRFHHQWIGRQNKKLEIKCIPEWLRTRFCIQNMHRRPDLFFRAHRASSKATRLYLTK